MTLMREYVLIFVGRGGGDLPARRRRPRARAMRIGAIRQVRDRDVHAIPIPYFGGVAMLGRARRRLSWSPRQLPFLSTRRRTT